MDVDELRLRSPTADATREIGASLAAVLLARDAVVLTGDLGAGKTTLVQGVARGLGVDDHVASPTFTLVKEYRGRLELAHVDVYRLGRMQDVVDLGLDELVADGAVLLVEWGDAVEELLGDDRLTIELTTVDPFDDPDDPGGGHETRRIALRAEGASWRERWPLVTDAVAPWRSPT
jgi:tRNA threonylcarbamoyladenosine biosynthesis protein TsaE